MTDRASKLVELKHAREFLANELEECDFHSTAELFRTALFGADSFEMVCIRAVAAALASKGDEG